MDERDLNLFSLYVPTGRHVINKRKCPLLRLVPGSHQVSILHTLLDSHFKTLTYPFSPSASTAETVVLFRNMISNRVFIVFLTPPHGFCCN